MKRRAALLMVLLTLALAACANHPAQPSGTVAESEAANAPRDVYVGMGVSGIAADEVAPYMAELRAEMAQQLSPELKQQELSLAALADGSLLLRVTGDVSFEPDSGQLQVSALDLYSRIAAVLRQYGHCVIHVVGHEDASVSEPAAQSLSERHAASLAAYLGRQGVSAARLRYEGRGAREPVASNQTAEGQRQNRGVDLVIKPVVTGREPQAWMPPPYLGA
ncbi:MAG: OmpA family protein [Stenotrophobium sp.]